MTDDEVRLPEVEITVDWTVDHVPIAIDATEAASLLRHGLEAEGRSGAWEVAIRFVADADMRAFHEAFLGDAAATDIMTFPYDPDEGAPGADILICVDSAAEHARQHGWALPDELRFLILHGLLHIVGWDDHDDAARKAMLDRQYVLLETWLPDKVR